MIAAIREDEGRPKSYPDKPSDLSETAADLDADALWARIEAYTSQRWGEREVVWIVEGPGEWSPRLQPATVDQAERWEDGWQTVELEEGPLGYVLESATYRVTATVGTSENPPAEVLEAYRRLAEYLADQAFIGRVATSGTRDVGGLSVTSERPQAWQAKALQHSGAADLLRRYR